jgi:hypothetical protein
MTTIQKILVTAIAAGAIAFGVYQAGQISKLREQVQTLRQQRDQPAPPSSQLEALRSERDLATNALAVLTAENAALKTNPNPVLRLRGEVSRLQRENAEIGSSNALSKVTSNPEMRKLLRDQQKVGMAMIYKGFALRAKLTPEQTDKLNELLADHVMENVGHVTTVLHDKMPAEQMNELFAAQEAALQKEVQALLGSDAQAQYQDYTKNLLSTLTAEQFKGMLTGDDPAKQEKSKQLAEVMQEAVQAALAGAGLPADYQAVPMLNFRNIASEQAGEQSIQLLDDIYQRATTRAASFLSAEDLAKFQEFKTTAINNNRAALSVNRTIMAPISK